MPEPLTTDKPRQRSQQRNLVFGAPVWPSLLAAFGFSFIAWADHVDSVWFRMTSILIIYIGLSLMPLPRTFTPVKPALISLGASLLIIGLLVGTTILVHEVLFPAPFAQSAPGAVANQAITALVAFALFRWAMPVLPSYESKHASNR
ncbi:MAG: hypothetical protein Q4A03_04755 [Rothia sp. (in: high G+C Gram-positive bacteria)]|nr:hypothetical protein [Rothia sp. (in: high G+C Gram-positive bacteria)]